jgi:hypothetical protein
MPLAVLAACGAIAVSAGPAAAAPYNPSAQLSVTTSIPAIGGTVSGTLTGFGPNEQVQINLENRVFRLGTVSTDVLGGGAFAVTLPPQMRCRHTLIATGATSHRVAMTGLNIGNCPGRGPGADEGREHGQGNGDGQGNGHGRGVEHGRHFRLMGAQMPITGGEASLGAFGLSVLVGGGAAAIRRRRGNAG